jgi:NitT/TauT family transport system ATP-binding protein
LEDETVEKREKIVLEHLKLAELEDKKDKYPSELSGGQVQRIALARSLAHNPEVLLMDEPYGALDAYTRDKMQQWLLDVWATHKKTIIFVTHNIEEAIFLADRVLVLNNQKFVGEYKISFSRPRNESIKFSPEFNKLRQRIFESLNG